MNDAAKDDALIGALTDFLELMEATIRDVENSNYGPDEAWRYTVLDVRRVRESIREIEMLSNYA